MRNSCLILLAVMGLSGAASSAQDYELEIITPHYDGIQEEFHAAFNEHVGREVKIRWIKQGTGELIQLLSAKDRAERGASFGLDLFFGDEPLGNPNNKASARMNRS